MIDVTGDKLVYRHAKLLESISSGEGGKFLYAFYDKKYACKLLIKSVPSLYKDGNYLLHLDDFRSFILLENLLQEMDEVLQPFFADIPASQINEVDIDAKDVRDKEKEALNYMKQINNAFSYHGINAIYEALLEVFPKNASKSNIRTCIASLRGHYQQHASKIKIKSIYSVTDLMKEINFTKEKGQMYFTV